MKSDGSVISLAVVFMAAFSLFSMIGVRYIDGIVHGDLYRYGLQFSYEWATPYWNLTGLVFAMGWINIIAAIGIHLYTLAFRRKQVEQLVTEVEEHVREREKVPLETVEEQKAEGSKPVQTVEKQNIDASVSVTETGTLENEDKPTAIECEPGRGEAESKQPEEVEGQEEQEPVRPAESKTKEEEREGPSSEQLAENDKTSILA